MADWREQLGEALNNDGKARVQQKGSEMERFIAEVALPAFEQLSVELTKHGRQVTIRNAVSSAAISVHFSGEEEITYWIQGRTFPNGVLPYAEIRLRERKGLRLITVESMIRSGNPDYALSDITVEEVIANFIDRYSRQAAKS